MMHSNRDSLLALLLSTILVAVQTAVPWMHVGCQHDHSAQAATTHAGHNCRHHKHAAKPASDTAVVEGHQHGQTLSDDCAACRFLLLSSARCEPSAVPLVQQVSLLDACPLVADCDCQPLGVYRSRAPPALS